MRNIPALTGLRGLGAMMVMFHHIFLYTSSSQFIGVDMFFVISGFFTTRILIKQESIDFSDFYTKRFLRLYPILIPVVLISLFFNNDIVGAIYALTSTFNFAKAFDSSHTHGILGPLWSLSITEQFYLFWPIVIMAVVKNQISRKKFMITLAMVVIGIWLVRGSLIAQGFDGAIATSITPLRIDGLLMGSIAALTPSTPRRSNLGLISFIGIMIVGILIPLTFQVELTRIYYLNFWTWILPIIQFMIAVILLDLVSNEKSLLHIALSGKSLMWIGVRSYSVYLLHMLMQEIMIFIMPDAKYNLVWQCITVILTLVVSYFSHKYLGEIKMRKLQVA